MSEIDEQQLMKICQDLQEEVAEIKQLKLATTIQQFAFDSRQQLAADYASIQARIQHDYAAKRNQLNAAHSEYLSKCLKNQQDIKKQLQAFETILEELSEKKKAVEDDFKSKTAAVHAIRDRCSQEWKKNSNEYLKRVSVKEMLMNPTKKNRRRSEEQKPLPKESKNEIDRDKYEHVGQGQDAYTVQQSPSGVVSERE